MKRAWLIPPVAPLALVIPGVAEETGQAERRADAVTAELTPNT
ncbi:hypothetical protein [Methanopyrus sp.]